MNEVEIEKAEILKVKQVTGEVKIVDIEAMTITVVKMVKVSSGRLLSPLDDKTKIVCDKEKKIIADVKVGYKVTIKYAEYVGKNLAKSIAVKQ
jgi:hypothetical protein